MRYSIHRRRDGTYVGWVGVRAAESVWDALFNTGPVFFTVWGCRRACRRTARRSLREGLVESGELGD